VRISFQRSGGRGEYELAERSNGIDAAHAVGHDLVLQVGTAEITTGIKVTHQQGKYRLRLNGGGIQVGRQVAAALMMPKPVRDRTALPPGARRLATGEYIVDDVKLENAQLTDSELRARAIDVDFEGTGRVGVPKRWGELLLIGRDREALPGDLPALLARHQDARQSGSVGRAVERLVTDIQRSLAQQAAALGIDYEEGEDPVPALLAALHLQQLPIGEPQPAEPLPAEPIEIKRREVKRARAWLRRRTAASVRFSRDVRAAYNHTCVVCGERFPPTPHTVSGVEADHILPWADYDIDQVRNGLCLCKTHHWMVDEGLLVLEYNAANTNYHVVVPGWVPGLAASGFSVAAIQACAGPIPARRLPTNAGHRPDPELLARAAQLIA
jgi:hypothetical protein